MENEGFGVRGALKLRSLQAGQKGSLQRVHNIPFTKVLSERTDEGWRLRKQGASSSLGRPAKIHAELIEELRKIGQDDVRRMAAHRRAWQQFIDCTDPNTADLMRAIMAEYEHAHIDGFNKEYAVLLNEKKEVDSRLRRLADEKSRLARHVEAHQLQISNLERKLQAAHEILVMSNETSASIQSLAAREPEEKSPRSKTLFEIKTIQSRIEDRARQNDRAEDIVQQRRADAEQRMNEELAEAEEELKKIEVTSNSLLTFVPTKQEKQDDDGLSTASRKPTFVEAVEIADRSFPALELLEE